MALEDVDEALEDVLEPSDDDVPLALATFCQPLAPPLTALALLSFPWFDLLPLLVVLLLLEAGNPIFSRVSSIVAFV